MADYVVLCKLTEAGAKMITKMPATLQRSLEGDPAPAPAPTPPPTPAPAPVIKVIGSYLLFGSYDWIFLVEAPDDETLARAVLKMVAGGMVTSETLRAFDPEACAQLFQTLG